MRSAVQTQESKLILEALDGASEVETMGLDLELHRMNESIKSTPKFRCPICGDDFALEIPDMETPCCHLLTHTFCNDETLKENGRCWNCNANQISSKFPASVASSKGPNYMYQRGRGPNTKLKESRGSSKQTCRMTLKEFLRKYPHGTQPGRSPWPREAVASRKPSEKHPDTHHVSTVPKECEKAEAVQHLNDATDRLVQACVLYASKVTEEEKTRILGKILEGLSGMSISLWVSSTG